MDFEDEVGEPADCVPLSYIADPLPEYRSVDKSVAPEHFSDIGIRFDQRAQGRMRNKSQDAIVKRDAFVVEWKMPWLPRVLPNIILIAGAHPERTLFTRFIPAKKPGQGASMWRRYYERWEAMTINRLGAEMIDLVPDLARFVSPARIFDKHVYSPWTGSDLNLQLRGAGVDTLIVTEGETDVCVLATVLGAIDWGFRVILVTDAVCGSADETHDSMMNFYMNHFGQQVECVTTETLLNSWPGGARARPES